MVLAFGFRKSTLRFRVSDSASAPLRHSRKASGTGTAPQHSSQASASRLLLSIQHKATVCTLCCVGASRALNLRSHCALLDSTQHVESLFVFLSAHIDHSCAAALLQSTKRSQNDINSTHKQSCRHTTPESEIDWRASNLSLSAEFPTHSAVE